MKSKRAGLSIIEVIVVIGLLTASVSIIFVTLKQTWLTFIIETKRSELQLESNVAVDRIKRQARQTVQIVTGYTNLGTGTQLSSNNRTIILQIPSIDSNNNIITGFDVVIYDNPAGTSILTEYIFPGGGSSRKTDSRILTNNLNTINFTYYDDLGAIATNLNNTRKVTIDLTLSDTIFGQNLTEVISQYSYLRNK